MPCLDRPRTESGSLALPIHFSGARWFAVDIEINVAMTFLGVGRRRRDAP